MDKLDKGPDLQMIELRDLIRQSGLGELTHPRGSPSDLAAPESSSDAESMKGESRAANSSDVEAFISVVEPNAPSTALSRLNISKWQVGKLSAATS